MKIKKCQVVSEYCKTGNVKDLTRPPPSYLAGYPGPGYPAVVAPPLVPAGVRTIEDDDYEDKVSCKHVL